MGISASPLAVAAAAGSADSADAAAAALELLAPLTNHVSAAICLCDPFEEQHRTLASTGYSTHVLDHLNGGFVRFDPAYHLLRRQAPRARRWRDLEFDYRQTYSAACVFSPAGYSEGISACLYAPTGRYAGALHASFDDPSLPTDGARDVIDRLRAVLGALCASAADHEWLSGTLPRGGHAVAVGADGGTTAVPGRDAGPHLAEGGELCATAMAHVRGLPGPERFLWRDSAGAWHGVTFVRFTDGVLVHEETTALPYELTPRELDVLALVARGLANREIAEQLVVTSRTVATHIEHLLAKLGVRGRAGLAATAVREGLLPHAARS